MRGTGLSAFKSGIMTQSDQALTDHIKTGRPGALEALIRRYQEKVMRTAYGYTGNQADAEDIFQETFAEVVRSIDSFRGESEPGTWIYRIAIRKAQEHHRRKQRKWVFQWFSDSEDESSEPADPDGHTPESLLIGREDLETLRVAVNRLPDLQRQAITLFYFNDLPYQDVADVMETSVSAVESLLFRARRNLKKTLERQTTEVSV